MDEDAVALPGPSEELCSRVISIQRLLRAIVLALPFANELLLALVDAALALLSSPALVPASGGERAARCASGALRLISDLLKQQVKARPRGGGGAPSAVASERVQPLIAALFCWLDPALHAKLAGDADGAVQEARGSCIDWALDAAKYLCSALGPDAAAPAVGDLFPRIAVLAGTPLAARDRVHAATALTSIVVAACTPAGASPFVDPCLEVLLSVAAALPDAVAGSDDGSMSDGEGEGGDEDGDDDSDAEASADATLARRRVAVLGKVFLVLYAARKAGGGEGKAVIAEPLVAGVCAIAARWAVGPAAEVSVTVDVEGVRKRVTVGIVALRALTALVRAIGQDAARPHVHARMPWVRRLMGALAGGEYPEGRRCAAKAAKVLEAPEDE